jgi:signal transduction histidine kinase
MVLHPRPVTATILSILLSCLLMMVPSLAPASDAPDSGAATSSPGETVQIDDTTGYIDLGLALNYLEDPTGALGIDDVRSAPFSERFQPSQRATPAFGFTASAYWLRVDLRSGLNHRTQRLLEIAYPPLQHIDLYIQDDKHSGALHHEAGGMAILATRRALLHRNHVFVIAIPAESTVTLWIRAQTEGSMTLPLRLWTQSTFSEKSVQEYMVHGIYVGIMLCLVAYNLFIWSIVREATYLLYALFILSTLCFFATLAGHGQAYLWQTAGPEAIRIIPAAIGFIGIFSVIFTALFLDSRNQPGRIHTLLKCLLLLSFSLPLVAVFVPYRIAIISSTVVGIVWAFGLTYSGIVATLNGSRPARYYTMAWVFFLAGSLLQGLRAAGIVPTNLLTEYAQFAGSAIEGLLLSVALADRMREMKTRELAANTEAVAAREDSLREKQIALDITQRYSEKLEAEVASRTRELMETQQKLVASEKMAALGVFTAGMAHEINNPANFISVGAQNAASQLADVKTFVADILADDDDSREVRQAFDDYFGKIEASHQVVQDGVQRITQVVQRLRATRPEGETGMRPESLADILDAASQLLESTLKQPVTLDRQFTPSPPVVCAIAEIHEVFLALLTNATHAIEDASPGRGERYHGIVRLRTYCSDGQVCVEVTDNGVGMPESILGKIFDPFFTTKTVGRGAGLGLSMARDIVHKHHGLLTARSITGEGSTFTVSLPCTDEPVA